jgi:CheY-like chemotaxis protein
MIAVSDTGAGIPASLLEKVFEPFYTNKDVGKGSGLGLSMVYGLVKQSNRHIKIYSEEGHGTTVKLYLPQAVGVADALPAEAGISEFVRGDESILVVEDDALVREYVVTQISRLGYDTLAANGAAEALAIINGPERIDLLFTDVIMPGGMNGRQLAIEAQTRRPELKILYTSGYTENAIVHHGRLDAGVLLLLPKPYLGSDLARMIRTALAS